MLKPVIKPKKRLFIGLLAGSLLAVIGLMGGMWYLIEHRMETLNQILLLSIAGILLGLLTLVTFGIGGIVLTLWRSKAISPLQGVMRITVSALFPVVMTLGRFVGLDKETIRSSFIEVNNQLVLSQVLKFTPQQILLLAPHCIQKHTCPHKITVDVDNCQRCGGCVVDQLVDIRDRYGVSFAVATGGTLARKCIAEHRPKAVIAVACERDLTSGIQDSNPLPVLGVLNARPNGPCFDTTVDLVRVERAIKYFIGRE